MESNALIIPGIPNFADFCQIQSSKMSANPKELKKRIVDVLQLNIGLYCNQVSISVKTLIVVNDFINLIILPFGSNRGNWAFPGNSGIAKGICRNTYLDIFKSDLF